MPQVYPKNYDSLEAFRRHGARPKVCTVSYFDLPRPSHESGAWAGDLRARLGPLDGLVLTCVGPDEDLDDFSAPDYHETAILVGASAVTTPDEYIYREDDPYPESQRKSYARAKARAAEVVRNAGGRYSVIGLAVGKDERQVTGYMDFLAGMGVRDQAFPCGDYIKGGRPYLPLARAFARHAREKGLWDLALGIGSYRLLRQTGIRRFSNSNALFRPPRKWFDTDQPFGDAPRPTREQVVRAYYKRRLDKYVAIGDRLGGGDGSG